MEPAGRTWETRTLRFLPSTSALLWFPPKRFSLEDIGEDGDALLHRIPSAGAAEDEVVTFIRRQTERAKVKLKEIGISLPAGSALLWDGDSGTLAVRTIRAAMALLESVSQDQMRKVTCYVDTTLNVVQAEGAALRQAARESSSGLDHSNAWKKLEEAVAAGKGQHLQTLHLENRNGGRSRMESGNQQERVTGFTVDETGVAALSRESTVSGASLELEPAVTPDRRYVNFTTALQYHFASGSSHELLVTPSSGGGQLRLPAVDDNLVDIQTYTTAKSGAPFLLGMWKPTAPPALAQQDVLQAAFLLTRVVRNLPLENPRALSLLVAQADKVAPIPQAASTEGEPPWGMDTVRYPVPRDFLSIGGGDAPSDPFNSIVEMDLATANALARKILAAQGIPFPEGADACYDAASGGLIVTNTPLNLRLVEAYVSDMECWRRRVVHVTLEIVEADGALLRSIAREAAAVADHIKLLERLDVLQAAGTARPVSVARLSTYSGQRAIFQAGSMQVSGVSSAPAAPTEEGATARHEAVVGSKKEEPGEKVTDGPRATGASGRGTVSTLDRRMVGTFLEVDPVMGPDGRTMDVDFALEHHFAPPSRLRPTANPEQAGGDMPISESSAQTYHMARVQGTTTLESGMTRLVGLWKPQGTPEYDGKDLLQAAFLRVEAVWMD